MGKWLEKNGEAIYGTGHTPFFNTGITWKCTTKPGKLYFHILHWPGTRLEILGLESRVTSARFLKDGSDVDIAQSGNILVFDLPEEPLDPYNTVIVADIEDQIATVTPGKRFNDPQEKVVLNSRDGRMRGEAARYDMETRSVSGYLLTGTPKNELWWYHYPHQTDTFIVSIEYACEDQLAGSSFYLKNMNRDTPEESQELNGIIEGTGGEFRIVELGEMSFREGEYQIINFGLNDSKSVDVRVKRVILNRLLTY